MSKNVPTNKKLYARVKAEAKRKFDRWPSAYGSAWLVKTYKSRGGTYRKAEEGMEVPDYGYGGGMNYGDYAYMYGGEDEYGYGGQDKYAKGGGIPERYKKMGFTKVGAKKKSTRPGKKWMVLAKKGDKYKVVHGGFKGMKDFKQHGSTERKKRFWDRMGGKDSAKAKDPFSPLYWHKRFGTWEDGGEFEPHMMYDPKTGKGYMAEKYEDHLKMDKMGFEHDAPEMGYGGDLYKAAVGGAIVPMIKAAAPIVKAVAPAVIGAFNKNKQAPVPHTINIYNTTPQQSMNTEEEMMYGNGGYKYAQGGTNNAGFKALPPQVQQQILENMAEGGQLYQPVDIFNTDSMDFFKHGGQPCFSCGGQKELRKHQTAPGETIELDEVEVTAQAPMGLQPRPIPNFMPAIPQLQLVDFTGRYTPTNTMPDPPTEEELAELAAYEEEQKAKPFKTDGTLDKSMIWSLGRIGIANVANQFMENNASRKREAMQRQNLLTDNFVPMAVGDRGDYEINTGIFRPDDYVPTQFQSYMAKGGQIGMVDDKILQELIAAGADIEILD